VLHWAFAGTVGPKLSLHTTLDPRGFIGARGASTRSLSDAPVVVTGSATLSGGIVQATWADAHETWTNQRPSGASPIFSVDRRNLPAHDPPSGDQRRALFAAFASFQALPAVQPYVARADFQAAIHQAVADTTDFGFYRGHPDALRVMGKPIDPISLLEARLRADAFRFPLAEKARRFARA